MQALNNNNIERTFRLTFFRDAFDNRVQQSDDYTWAELIELLKEHRITQNKNEVGFIAARFKTVSEGAVPAGTNANKPIAGTVGRYGSNIAAINCMVLDYDGGTTIEQAREQIKGLKHIGYTSFNHLKDGVTHKFRIVIPLAQECSAEDWSSRRKAMIELFPEADESGFAIAHLFFAPATPGGREVLTWNEDGDELDIMQLPQVIYKAPSTPSFSDYDEEFKDEMLKQVQKCNFNKYDDWKALGGRLYNAGYSLADFQHLSWTDAQKECVTLWKWYERQGSPNGIGALVKRIRDEFPNWTPPEKPDTLALVKKEGGHAPILEDEEPVDEVREEVTMNSISPQRTFKACTSPAERSKRVKGFFSDFMKAKNNCGVLRTAEGYGKSTVLVEEALASGNNVIFCSASNKQADEKMIDFAKHDAHRVWSRGGLIEATYGVKPVYKDQAPDEWGDPGLDVEATIEVIRSTGAEFDKFDLEALGEKAALSRETDAKLVVTTFSMADMMFRNAFGHIDRVVIVDDPSLSDMVTVRYEQEDYDHAPMISTERSSKDVVFGQEFWNQCKVLFTTTEMNVMTVIKKHHPDVMVKDMTQDLETNDNILLLSSSLVYKVTRKILPGIHQAVMEDTNSEQELIANGVKHQFNLVNTKGRNDLMKDTVIILSRPHPCDIAAVTHTLGLETTDRERVMQQMVVDQLNQALGRSQAYRGAGGHRVLVICDPKLELVLRNKCRYRLNTWEGLSRRGRLNGVPLLMHVHTPDWWAAWYSYLLTWQQWVVVIGDKVYETLSMKKLGLADDERKLIDKKLKKPPPFSHLVWKKRSEVLEGEGTGRRNFTLELYELVDEFNKDQRATHMKEVGKKNSGKKGLKNFRAPDGQVKRYVPGSEPEGWIMCRPT